MIVSLSLGYLCLDLFLFVSPCSLKGEWTKHCWFSGKMHISRGTQRLSRRKALLVWALVVLAVHLHASEGVEAVPAVSLTSSDTVAPLSKTQTVKVLLHHGWKACRFGSTGSTRYSSSGRTATSSSSSTNAWRYPSQGCGNSASAGSTTCTSEVCSDATNDTSLPRLLHVSRLPTTALTVLLENGLINVTTTNKDLQNSATGTMEDRLYFGTNLAQIPDISQVGRAFYTLLYQYDFDFSRYPHPNNFYSDIDRSSTAGNTTASTTKSTAVTRKRHILRLAGVNYRAVAWLDGKLCPELQVPQFSQYRHQEENTNNHSNKHSGDEDFAPGMFRRRAYDVTGGGRFVLLVEPPDHPGIPIQPQQQGGNHDLARDGAVPQYMLGWDWCQAMPDRATGFYGSVVLETTTTISTMSSPSSLPDGDNDEDDDADPWSLLDVAIQTIGLRNCSWFNDPPTQRYGCDKVMLRILARAEGSVPAFTMERGRSTASKQMTASLIVQSDWGESWTIPIANNHTTNDNQSNENNKFINDEKDLVQVEIMVRDNPRDNVHLWWPHGVLRGLRVAHRHQFTVSLIVNNRVTDVHTIHTGIRSVSTWLDEDLQGQRFRINGQNVYLVGGNWIGTDQALRTSASTRRYCSEIALHRYAGLNLIRVWGGGTAERDDFYQCADRLGILVWQEFWMTGDNNGRWAGNYNWPENHSAYLYHIRDTVQRLRGYASLLFYSGCNECLAPKGANDAYPNPPRSIDDGIRTILNDFDPGRFYISSSMGGVSG